MTGIGALIGIPAIVVGLVLAIVALAKKQKYKGLSISAVVVAVLTISIGTFAIIKVVQYSGPLIDYAQKTDAIIKQDPELKALMENVEFKKAFQANLENRLNARKAEMATTLSGENVSIEETMSMMTKVLNEETMPAIQETKAQFAK